MHKYEQTGKHTLLEVEQAVVATCSYNNKHLSIFSNKNKYNQLTTPVHVHTLYM